MDDALGFDCCWSFPLFCCAVLFECGCGCGVFGKDVSEDDGFQVAGGGLANAAAGDDGALAGEVAHAHLWVVCEQVAGDALTALAQGFGVGFGTASGGFRGGFCSGA